LCLQQCQRLIRDQEEARIQAKRKEVDDLELAKSKSSAKSAPSTGGKKKKQKV
jgi:hypothetical protein